MAQSDLECANAALIKLGNSTITALSDTSKEATTANARIDVVKKALLRSHPWNFACNRKTTEVAEMTVDAVGPDGAGTSVDISGVTDHSLSPGDYVYFSTAAGGVGGLDGPFLVTADGSAANFTIALPFASITGDPVASGTVCWKSMASDWVYLLPSPTSCLRILSVTNGSGADVEYKMEAGGIATNDSEVTVAYIKDVTDYTLMDSLFYEALSAYLAWDICFQLTQSNELKSQLWNDFRSVVAQAKFVDATEDSQQMFEANDWITARSQNYGS